MGVLDGKVAVVTGGTSGIGARTVELFVAEGAKVVIAGRRQDEGDALTKRLGRAASFARTDVSREPDVKALVEQTLARHGRIDCLFNNAGIPGKIGGIADLDIDHLDSLLAVHVRGVALGMKHAAPVMQRQGSGSIINTASIAGLWAGISGHIYSTVKAAVIHLTRSVAAELGEHGIRVNSISPGAIVTGIFGKGAGVADATADRATEGLTARFAKAQPVPRAGLPEDIAQAALFLASDASSFIAGQDIVVDGGLTTGQPWSRMLSLRQGIADELKAQAG